MRQRYHALKRVRFRQSWNKYNLYNFLRMIDFIPETKTLFQQKWLAKSRTRTYHGGHIREKKWQRMFRPRFDSVVSMNPRYLAEHDGSEHAAGRGSGKDNSLQEKERNSVGTKLIPYMHMTYAQMERRLDVAIFRALFASSTVQARQFVVRGKVKVNGQKMPYSGYLLNPGDMFQVDMDQVLWATGAPKPRTQIRAARRLKKHGLKEGKTFPQKANAAVEAQETEDALESALAEDEALQVEESPESLTVEEKPNKPLSEADLTEKSAVDKHKKQRSTLKELTSRINSIIENSRNAPKAKAKQALRELKSNAKVLMSKVQKQDIEETDRQIRDLTARLAGSIPSKADNSKGQKSQGRNAQRGRVQSSTAKDEDDEEIDEKEDEEDEPDDEEKNDDLEDEEDEDLDDDVPLRRTNATHEENLSAIRLAAEEANYNPVDVMRPYATPWSPKPYMSAFAFVPRYLEVNHNICAAVYLRHPVARAKMSEVPSPYGEKEMQLAFSWYLRRR